MDRFDIKSPLANSGQPASGQSYTYPPEPPKKSSAMPWIILALVIAAVAVVGVLFRDRLFAPIQSSGQPAAGAEKYQAVFLSNGQVYFGKISNVNDPYVILRDIYYLQVTQPPLQGPAEGQANQPTQQQPQISLVKLGKELHGPVDEMRISKYQILFYEDLQEDGQVVQAIKEYKKNPK